MSVHFQQVSLRVMVFNAIFNDISIISWGSVLLVEYPDKTTDLSQVTDKLHHIAKKVITHTFPLLLSSKKEHIQKVDACAESII